MKNRIALWYASVLLAFALVVMRLFYWQIMAGSELNAMASVQHHSTFILPASRGEILTDDDFPIVTNKPAYLLFAYMPDIEMDTIDIANRLAPITIKMQDYGNMEKVGSLGRSFPRNDEQITTQAGDIILYQGNALVIYYASNSWNFTRLGKIDNISANELKDILGKGNVTVTLSLP